jgi:c-di-GMP-binding flagellar brake protein YcgR
VRIFLPGNQVRIVTGPYVALVGHVFDISAGGVRFYCESDLGNNEFIELEIVLPSGKIKLDCRVVHTERDPQHRARLLYGVEFLNLVAPARAELEEYIANIKAAQEPEGENK